MNSLENEFNQVLLELFQEVEENGAQRIVVDTLQSFLTLATGKMSLSGRDYHSELRNIIFRIMELCRQTDATALLLSEEGSTSFEEYIVDGVFHLGKRDFNGKKIREIIFRKMRRTRISRERFLMTMEDGKLDCFHPYDSFRRPPLLRVPDHEPFQDAIEGDPSSGTRFISSGIPDFDRKLLNGKGFRYGS